MGELHKVIRPAHERNTIARLSRHRVDTTPIRSEVAMGFLLHSCTQWQTRLHRSCAATPAARYVGHGKCPDIHQPNQRTTLAHTHRLLPRPRLTQTNKGK